MQNSRRPLLRHLHSEGPRTKATTPLTKTMPFFTSANCPLVHAYDLGCPMCWRCWWFWGCWYPWPRDVTPVIDVNELLWGLPRWWPRWQQRQRCRRRIRPVEYLQHAQQQNQTSQLRDLVQAMAKHTQKFESELPHVSTLAPEDGEPGEVCGIRFVEPISTMTLHGAKPEPNLNQI